MFHSSRSRLVVIPNSEGIYRFNSTRIQNEFYQLKLARASDLTINSTKIVRVLNKAKHIVRRAAKSITLDNFRGTYYLQVMGRGQYQLQLTKAFEFEKPAPVKELLGLVNQERTSIGLNSLLLTERLSRRAQAHSVDMAQRNYFGHSDTSWAVDFSVIAENVAGGFETASAAHRALMNSPGHRANLLYGAIDEIGLGFYFHPQSNYQYYWTEIFGSAPSSLS